MLGLAFFLLGRLFSNLAVLNDWPPLFAAAFPIVVFIGVGIALLWMIERRCPRPPHRMRTHAWRASAAPLDKQRGSR
jgi:O-antigen/teichoic acid export membrane protein